MLDLLCKTDYKTVVVSDMREGNPEEKDNNGYVVFKWNIRLTSCEIVW